MERFGLAALLVVVVPSLAPAQGVEVGLFAGGFQPVPSVRTEGELLNCDEEPCPSSFRRTARGAGTAIGGRLTFQMSSRYGVDVIVQTTRMTNASTSSGFPDGLEHVRLILVTVQPHAQFALNESMQVVLGAGIVASFANATTVTPSAVGLMGSGMRPGVSVSSALYTRLADGLSLAMRSSVYNYVLKLGDQNRLELTWGFGLAYAFQKRRAA